METMEPAVDLSMFVDRVEEVGTFCRMLGNGSKPIMFVWGEAEIGKTQLMYKMAQECASRKLRSILFLWNEYRDYECLEVMRGIRERTGPKYFRKFTRLEKSKRSDPTYAVEMTSGGRSSVAEGATISGTVNRMGNVLIEHQTNNFALSEEQMAEAARLRKTRMLLLTDAFIAGLAQAAADGPIVIFFDPVEKISDDTKDWIWGELFRAVIERRLQNVKIVLCGQPQPQLKASHLEVVDSHGLRPFELKDIVEYLRLRFRNASVEVTDGSLELMAMGIVSSNYPPARYPGEVFKSAFTLIESYQQRSVREDG